MAVLALTPPRCFTEEKMGISGHLSAADVILDLDAATKRDVLRLLAAEAAGRLDRPERDVLGALTARERLESTALGQGVVLPHARLAGGSAPSSSSPGCAGRSTSRPGTTNRWTWSSSCSGRKRRPRGSCPPCPASAGRSAIRRCPAG